MDKSKVIKVVKYCVLVSAVAMSGVSFLGNPLEAEDDFDTNSLMSSFGASPGSEPSYSVNGIDDEYDISISDSSNDTSIRETSHASLRASTPNPPVANKTPEFVPAPDYRTIIAAIKLMDGAINPEVEKQWIGQRLAVNAQRERTRNAQLELEEVQALHKAAMMNIQIESLGNETGNINSDGTFVARTMPSVQIVRYTAAGSGLEASATISVEDREIDVREGSVFDGVTVSNMTDDGCLEINNGASLQHVCI